MLIHNQIIRQHPASCNPSRVRQALLLGITTFVALCGRSASSHPIDGRRLLEEVHELEAAYIGAPHVQLLHWSHPESPLYSPGLSLAERFKYSVQASKDKAAGLSSGMAVVQKAPGLSSNETFVDPESNLQFEYGMVITIGTPPHTFTGIADTGSDLVWIQCAPCSGCAPQSNPLFDPNKSSTYTGVPCNDPLCVESNFTCESKTCEYEYSYGGGEATTGELSYETITFTTTTGSTQKAKKFAFGCAHQDYGGFFNEDGLVGLGKGPLSFTTQLGSLYGEKFSYCLVSLTDSANKTSPLLFGDASVPKGDVKYTPIVENPVKSFFGSETFYYIGLKGIKVNGEDLNIPADAFGFNDDGSGGVISDSGTAITTLVGAAYTPLSDKMKSLIKYPPGSTNNGFGLEVCYDVSGVKYPKFPNVTFVFDGMSLDLPQDNVFILIPVAYGGDNNTVCMAIEFGGDEAGFNIFGNVQQQNFQYLHDRKNNRYGFAPVQCDTLTS